MLKLDPGSDLFPHRWAASDFKLLYLASQLSVYILLLKIFETLIKKSSDLGQNVILKLIPDTVSTSGCRCKIRPQHILIVSTDNKSEEKH